MANILSIIFTIEFFLHFFIKKTLKYCTPLFMICYGEAEKEDKDQKNQDKCSTSPTENIQKSVQSVDDSCPKNIMKEHQESGGISLVLYKKYFQAGGGLLAFLTIMSCSVLAQVLV